MPKKLNPLYTGLHNPYRSNDYSISGGWINIACDVSRSDHAFLKSNFPFLIGQNEIVLSNLFHAFIRELRREYELHPQPPAVLPDDPGYANLRSVLQRFTTGQPYGEASPRDDGRGASGVCETVCDAAQQCTDPQSSDGEGKRNDQKEEGGNVSGESNVIALANQEKMRNLLELLK